MNDMQLQCIGMLLIPLIIPILGFLYLFLAFRYEDYVEKEEKSNECLSKYE